MPYYLIKNLYKVNDTSLNHECSIVARCSTHAEHCDISPICGSQPCIINDVQSNRGNMRLNEQLECHAKEPN